jgi:hypothetical protein
MLRNHLIPAILAVLLSSCSEKPAFIVEGRVPDHSFEGSKIYLVALDAPITRDVDSTVVTDGKFIFIIKADSTEARIIRLPLRHSNMTQDLVVITEPGKVYATIAARSSGKGTLLNKRLQLWKEDKNRYDSLQGALFSGRDLQSMNKKDVDSLVAIANGMKDAFMPGVKSLINDNINNGIGLLLFKVYYDMLPASFRDSIDKSTNGRYYKKDEQLRKMRRSD